MKFLTLLHLLSQTLAKAKNQLNLKILHTGNTD